MVTAQADPEMWDIDRGRARARPIIAGVQRISTIGFCQDRGRFCAAWFWRFCCFAVKVGGLDQTQPSGAGRAEGRMDWSAGGVPPQGGLRLDLCVSAVCWLEVERYHGLAR